MRRKIILVIGTGAVVVAVLLFLRRQPTAPQIGAVPPVSTDLIETPSLTSSQVSDPAPAQPVKLLPERIAPLVREGLSYSARVEQLRELGTKFTSEEAAGLYDFLREHGLAPGLNAPATHAFKDAVMIALENQQPPLADWPESLIALYQDRAQDPVIRDYALQHLHTW